MEQSSPWPLLAMHLPAQLMDESVAASFKQYPLAQSEFAEQGDPTGVPELEEHFPQKHFPD